MAEESHYDIRSVQDILGKKGEAIVLGQLNMYGMDKVEVSIERLKAFEPEEGYMLAFSGGKDSCVIKALADMAGVKYDAHYVVTSVDPPELVQFIKKFHPDVIMDIPRYPDNYKNEKLRGKQITMWNLIPEEKMPPTRIARYCCKKLKEPHGEGRFVITGVRHSESVKRSKRGGLELAEKKSHRLVNYDPDDPTEEMFYHCQVYARKMLNPIIDWTEEDVWEFIHEHDIPYCELYDQGYKRLGCIGCPMGTVKMRERQLERYPKYKKAYIRAFDRMLAEREKKQSSGWGHEFNKGEDLFDAWRNAPSGMPFKSKSDDLVPASIEVHDKKITAVPKWDENSTGEEVMNWWIK